MSCGCFDNKLRVAIAERVKADQTAAAFYTEMPADQT
jgi:hypothetical protein